MSASVQSSEGIAPAGAAPAPADVLAIARQVLHEEADAVRAVADALAATPDFVACVGAILQLKGRVVVTGIGKSAHIAGKIEPRSTARARRPCSCTPPMPFTATWA